MIGVARVVLAMCIGLSLASSIALAQTESAADPGIGIWAGEMIFGPALRGELTIEQTRSSWRASISNAEALSRAVGGTIRFAFPDNRGQFRGALTDGGRAITGFWLQPSGVTAELAFATPLVLRRAGPRIWRGMVRPLDERFTLYLKVYRNAEGLLIGAFRSPEINSNGGASLFRVSWEGDHVLLTARPYEAQPEIRHNATLVRSPDRMQLFWPDVGSVLELVRRTPDEVPTFFPRPPGEPLYAYAKPPVTGDGWFGT